MNCGQIMRKERPDGGSQGRGNRQKQEMLVRVQWRVVGPLVDEGCLVSLQVLLLRVAGSRLVSIGMGILPNPRIV